MSILKSVKIGPNCFLTQLQNCSHYSEKYSLKYNISIYDIDCKVTVAAASVDYKFAVMPM